MWLCMQVSTAVAICRIVMDVVGCVLTEVTHELVAHKPNHTT